MQHQIVAVVLHQPYMRSLIYTEGIYKLPFEIPELHIPYIKIPTNIKDI